MLKIIKGNDVDFTVKVKLEGMPLNLENIEVSCDVKASPTGKRLFSAQVTKRDPANGVLGVVFTRNQTATLQPNSKVYFDFKFVFPDGKVKNAPSPPYEAVVVEPVTR